MYKVIEKNEINEWEIKKSKFLSFAFPVYSVDEANQLLSSIRHDHAHATHVCYAYKIGGTEKCSDDGEPSGTAGVPMLETIKKRQIDNILIVVVRYFGGIKLGAGGLIRAYSRAVSLVLDKCNEIVRKEWDIYDIKADYQNLRMVTSLLKDCKILDTKYNDEIVLSVAICDVDILKAVIGVLKDASKVEFVGKKFL